MSCTVNCKEIISLYTLNFPRPRTRFRSTKNTAHSRTCFDLFWLENPAYINHLNHRIHYQTTFDNNQSALSQTMRTVCQPITACSQDLGNPAGRWNTISDGVFPRATKEIGDVCTQANKHEQMPMSIILNQKSAYIILE